METSSGTDAYHASRDASLFSTSLPVLPHAKLNFNGSEQIGQSLDDGFANLDKIRLENEVKDPLEDIEPSTVGSFLPGDEDELLAGVMDDFDLTGLPAQLEDLDEDLFGSGGGLEIEPESHENMVNGMLRLSTSDGITGSSISQYGFTNGVGASCPNCNACITGQALRRRKLDIHFSIPKDNPSEKDINQGTLVVFNLDASVSMMTFAKYLELMGRLRRETHKRHHKFIEFYDVRAAEAALKALNRSDIAGKRIKLEPSRPGGARRSLIQQLSQEQELDEARAFLHQVGSPVANSPPGSWPSFGSPVEHNSLHGYSQMPKLGSLSPVGSNHLPGLASILPMSNPVKISPIGKDPGRISHVNQVITKSNTTQGLAFQNRYPVPDSKLSASSGPVSPFDYSKPSSVGTLSGPQFLWGSPTIHSDHINSSPWTSSLKGRPFPSSGQGIGFPYTNQRGPFLGSNHHVGSAPSGIQLERHFGFFPDSPETSYINQAAFGVTNFGHNGKHAVNAGTPGGMNVGVAFAGSFTDSSSPSPRMMSMPRDGHIYYGSGSFGAIINDGIIDGSRSRRLESGSQMDNKKQYQLDLEKIVNGEDSRTTLMIKHPQQNKCNVGYAFINMVSPSHIITFYEAFNGKKWEKFNSEKVASLAYARIQGKAALVSHFQNSSLMNEDKRCRPILFQSEGQGTGDLDAFPSGNLISLSVSRTELMLDSLDSPKGDQMLSEAEFARKLAGSQ
ncbi:protein MEI2-like 2 [Sesamum angolense]|uniref:Protein MEI2-like 2 n=1 Tax=Sesamum angolense TaxID=2727404 RepID=A0AAE1W5M7_9LAMI|nr:protein MEI2-like 2 [Sesamum angolense]